MHHFNTGAICRLLRLRTAHGKNEGSKEIRE